MDVDFDADGNKTLAELAISWLGTLRFLGVFEGVGRPKDVFDCCCRERRVLTSSSSDSGRSKVARLTCRGDLLGDMEDSSSGEDGGGERVAEEEETGFGAFRLNRLERRTGDASERKLAPCFGVIGIWGE